MKLGTLGPSGSNHALIAQRYLEHQTATPGERRLFTCFEDAFEALLNHELTHVLQCTAHASHSDCVGRYMYRAYPVDTFIAGSHPLALVVQRHARRSRQVAIQPATRHYADLNAFDSVHEVATTVEVAEGLLEGRFEAGICAAAVVEQAPQRLVIAQTLGPALDTWVVYGTHPLPSSSPLWLADENDHQACHHQTKAQQD